MLRCDLHFLYTIQNYFRNIIVLIVNKFGFELWRKTILAYKVCKDIADISFSAFVDVSHFQYTVKKVNCLSRPLTLPGRELLNYSRPGRFWLVTSRLGTGKTITFFNSVVFKTMLWKLVYSPTYFTLVWLTFYPVCLWLWGRGSGWRYWSTPADCTPRSKIGRNWREPRESHSPIRRTNSAFRLRTRKLCARDIR